MTIPIAGYPFEGPFAKPSELLDLPGVYVVLGSNNSNVWTNVVDVGKSDQIKTRIETHNRRDCWQNQQYKYLGVAVFYVDKDSQIYIEADIRRASTPPCGER